MAAPDFSKLLDKIRDDNQELRAAHGALGRAFEKLDTRLTVLKAGIRIEPYPIGKDKNGPVIGYSQFHDGWHITTYIRGLGDTLSEAPATEAVPELQVELMGHVGGLLSKLSDGIAAKVKAAAAASKEADRLIDAIRANS
jgi:hypothetical protein